MRKQLSNKSIKVGDRNLDISLELIEMKNMVESEPQNFGGHQENGKEEENTNTNNFFDFYKDSNHFQLDHCQEYQFYSNSDGLLYFPGQEILI